MHTREMLAVLLLLSCMSKCQSESPRSGAQELGASQPSPREVADLLRTRVPVRLEIVYVPREIQTQAPITPGRLEAHCWYRVGIQEFQWSAFRTDLISALDGCVVGRGTREPDCRWGCIFFDTKGARVLTMYFDGGGSRGLLNGTPVTGLGPVVRVLEKRCSPLWVGEVKYHPLADWETQDRDREQ